MEPLINDEWIEGILDNGPQWFWGKSLVRAALQELRDLYERERDTRLDDDVYKLRVEIACLRRALNDVRSGVTVYHGPQPQQHEWQPNWRLAPAWADWWAVDSYGFATWSDIEPPYMVDGEWYYPPGCRVIAEQWPYHNWLPRKRPRPREEVR